MPGLGLREERLDPDLTFAHRLGVGLGGVVAPHPVEIRLVEAARELPPVGTAGALDLQRAGVTGSGWCPVDSGPLGVLVLAEGQFLATGAVIDIALGFIGESIPAEQARSVIEV